MKPVARDLELVQTIIENPDDDAPRLIYADWLEEHGNQSRAEFIRAQCECARLFHAGKDLERAFALRVKHTELLREHEKEWVGEFPNQASSWTFERGFIEYIAVDGKSFVQHADSIFANTPIRRVYVFNVGPQLRQVADCPFLARLSHLHLSNIVPGDVMPLVRSPYLTNIAHLELWGHTVAPVDVRQLRTRFGNRVRF